ncbi:hypothetical protein [Mangrovibacterium marinum]|uniref:Uncharacterized protein n=1 Tax=Mangrovibacterium marinum TaxID=1639118 RepID=A0A2T5C0G4_9BACT|nr:hypothetical protein [Mangrovibacterium marinum]PTN08013.1 hypothetical protein C8N47_11153 [Mangrovibacterium marinum]
MNRLNEIENHPLYLKGKEIYGLASRIVDLIPDDDEKLSFTKQEILTNALLLMVKVAGAEAGALYDIKMESATIIRKAAHTLLLQYHQLKLNGFEEAEYYQMVRDLIEEYRLLFVDWVAGFDPTNYVVDRWGLFNPPGVGPNDKSPDDDIPFNIDDFEFDD